MPRESESWGKTRRSTFCWVLPVLMTLLVVLSIAPVAFVQGSRAVSLRSDYKTEYGVSGLAARAATTSVGLMQTETPLVSKNQAGARFAPLRSATLNSFSLGYLNSFDGIDQSQTSCGCYPPDVQVATGPNQVAEMVNLQLQVFTRQGVLLQNMSLSQFFHTSNDLSDPKILYDASSSRYFTSIIKVGGSYIITAVSSSSDATGNWTVYNLPPQSQGGNLLFPDQPILGINNDKVVISTNDFVNGVTMVGAQYWVLNKSEMVSRASSIDLRIFGPFANQESVHPVQSLSSTTTEYMVSTGAIELGTTGSVVEFYSISGIPPSTVTVSSANLTLQSSISTPPAAYEHGYRVGAAPSQVWNLGQSDARVLDAKWFQGKLWYSLHDGCTPAGDSNLRTCVRLTQINTVTSAVAQDFEYSAAGQYYYYPAVAIDSLGSLTVVYGFSSNTTYPGLAITGQRYDDPAYTVRQPKTLVNGMNATINGRYGDYFGTSVDPLDSTMVWVAGQYIDGVSCGVFGPCWSTHIASTSEYFGITPSDDYVFARYRYATSIKDNLTLTSFGFAGTVTLSTVVSPSGQHISTGLNPITVTLTSNGSGTSTLTISTTTQTYFGQYSVTVNGVSGSVASSTTITLCVYIVFKGQLIC